MLKSLKERSDCLGPLSWEIGETACGSPSQRSTLQLSSYVSTITCKPRWESHTIRFVLLVLASLPVCCYLLVSPSFPLSSCLSFFLSAPLSLLRTAISLSSHFYFSSSLISNFSSYKKSHPWTQHCIMTSFQSLFPSFWLFLPQTLTHISLWDCLSPSHSSWLGGSVPLNHLSQTRALCRKHGHLQL